MPWFTKVPDLKNNPLYLAPKVDDLTMKLADIVTVNLKVTNPSDITNDFINAITTIKNNGGGILNIPFKSTPLNMITGRVTLCNNLEIRFNGNKIVTPSSPTTYELFNGINLENVKISDVKIISTNDQTRVIANDGVPRSGLGSNIIGFNLHGKNIHLKNIYNECLEFGIQVKNGFSGAIGVSENVLIDNYRTYKTKQPLFMVGVYSSSFTNFYFDLTDVTDNHDHHVYLNGNCKDLYFKNINLKNGDCYSFNIKTDNPEDLPSQHYNIHITDIMVEESWGFFLQRCESVFINNYNKKSSQTAHNAFTLLNILDIFINNFKVDGDLGLISGAASAKNVYLSNGVMKNAYSHVISITDIIDSLFLDNIRFEEMPIDPTSRILYASPSTTINNMSLKNCQFIFTKNLTTQPISLKGTNNVVIDSCQFLNNATVYSAICYNLSPAKVIAKSNLYKGFTAFKTGTDTATTEYSNIALA